ncbi:cell division protein FtsQ/DivIB [Chrysiogenes arsenatis]|uniref:cell division protein FtsQ/DivIB n=1 Tax=Chrysiogenes arsenatis TaxID=309797 RepID=UPI0003FE234E|nr:FtsQ-type POTRA domain-containing protein [Chrysiogenes arsenatis]
MDVKRQIITGIIATFFFGVFGFGFYWFYYQSAIFDLRAVELKNNHFVDEETIASLFTKYAGQDILSLDINTVAQEVSQIPWVKSVAIYRKYTGVLRVVLTEFRPGYKLRNDHGDVYYVSSDGYVMELLNNRLEQKLQYDNIQLPVIHSTYQQLSFRDIVTQTPLLYSIAQHLNEQLLSIYNLLIDKSGIVLANDWQRVYLGDQKFPDKVRTLKHLANNVLTPYQRYRVYLENGVVYIQEGVVDDAKRNR